MIARVTEARDFTRATRRSMKKTTSIFAILAGLVFSAPGVAGAQTASQPDSNIFVNVSVGDQFQSHTLNTNDVVNVFGEDGTASAAQNVGRGFVFDATGGYRVWNRISIAVGISTFGGSGNAAVAAAIPDRLRFNSFTPFSGTVSDLKQSDVAVNFQAVWDRAITDRVTLLVFGGPSIIHVKQDIASVSVDPATGNASTAADTQSGTTGKAGSVGADVAYKVSDRYGVGVFVRYLGGSVDLPAAPSMKVGGAQAGAGIRIHF
jgi:hypothetical protein